MPVLKGAVLFLSLLLVAACSSSGSSSTASPITFSGVVSGANLSGAVTFTVGHDAGSAITGAYAGANSSGFISGTRGTTNTLIVTFPGGSAQGTIDGLHRRLRRTGSRAGPSPEPPPTRSRPTP